MNERIRELVRQAGLDDADFPIENWDNVPLAKFAELIVRECAGIAITAASDTNFITGISEADKRALSIAVEIKHHFGVKE